MRKIDKDDINWKDTAFLSKFMNDTGKILNKYQSRLPTSTHRKVAKTIKKVRDMEIFAHVGLLKPTDRIPVGSFIEDLEEMHKKTIDPVTGRLFLKHSLQDDLSEKEKRIFTNLENRMEEAESLANASQDHEAEVQQKVLREMSLESIEGRLVPDRAQRQWMIAQAHIVDRDGQLEEQARNADITGQTDYVKPPVEFLGAQEAYDESIKKIEKSDPTPNKIFEHFISEKSLKVENFGVPRDDTKTLLETAERVQIDEEENDIRRRIQSIMQEYTTSNATEGGQEHKYETDPKYWRMQNQ